jgi:hypothetical protein
VVGASFIVPVKIAFEGELFVPVKRGPLIVSGIHQHGESRCGALRDAIGGVH